MRMVSDWSTADVAAVHRAFEQHLQTSTERAHPWAKSASIAAGMRAVIEGRIGAVLFSGYALIYDYGKQWYSDKPVLLEQMLLRISDGPGDFTAVVTTMQKLARLHGCAGIVSGNSVSRPGLTRLYERAGFQSIGRTFYKEV